MKELIFLINTFNTDYYRTKAFALAESIKHALAKELRYRCVIVEGGSKINQQKLIQQDWHYLQIVENLSDHNIYVGFRRYLADRYRSATFVILHDTCALSKSFLACMLRIAQFEFTSNIPWIFAHSYGLYNMGICTYDFVIERAIEFENIDILPKEQGISLEQGASIQIQAEMIKGLLVYSRYTLAKMVCNVENDESYEDCVDKVDTYAINGISHDGKIRWMVYIAAFGVYKFMASSVNYQIPIWCETEFHPKTEEALFTIDDFAKANKMNFIPFLEFQK